MATHLNTVDIESFFTRIITARQEKKAAGVNSYSILEDAFKYGFRSMLGGGEGASRAPRTKPIEFWWENENVKGFIVNKPMIQVTPSNISTDKVTVRITNWGDSDEQLYAVTPL